MIDYRQHRKNFLKIKCGEMTYKDKLKLFLRVILFFICISGLTYQASRLVSQYIRGQTVVNIRVEKLRYSKIPAITICYPRFISMEKFVELFPESSQAFDEYQNLINSVNETDYDNKDLKKEMEDIYEHNFTRLNKHFDLPVYELFDELSLPFNFPKRPLSQFKKSYFTGIYETGETEYSIEIQANGKVKDFNTSLDYMRDYTPIESIAMTNKGVGYKCYTFFSELNKKWRKIKINLNFISIQINHDKNWFPPQVYDHKVETFQFSMHSTISIPDMSYGHNFIPLSAGYSNEITFSQIDTILLPPNYMTNCRNFDLDDENNEKLGTDCITKCILNTLKTKSSHCVHRTADLIRKEMFERNKFEKFCPIYNIYGKDYDQSYYYVAKNIHEIRSICEEKFHNECYKQFFDFDVKKKTKLPFSPWDKRTLVYITHNHLPDQVIEHLPEMTFISFVANFGGLLGIWLGLSAIAIFDFIIKFL